MKLRGLAADCLVKLSLPVRETQGTEKRRSPCGERGLKCVKRGCILPGCSRSPCGERGLKSVCAAFFELHANVAPRAGSVD